MKKIEGFKAEDGTLFESEQECINYENKKEFDSLIRILIEEHCYRGMDVEDVIDFITDYKYEFKEIFKRCE